MVGGLLFSTFLTLLLVPVVYRLLARFTHVEKAEAEAAEPAAAAHAGEPRKVLAGAHVMGQDTRP